MTFTLSDGREVKKPRFSVRQLRENWGEICELDQLDEGLLKDPKRWDQLARLAHLAASRRLPQLKLDDLLDEDFDLVQAIYREALSAGGLKETPPGEGSRSES